MSKSKPNVLFLITDDQRYGTIHALGNDEIQTPNMDRLVNNGTSFTRAYIPGGTTSAICMPSRAMIHSGRTLFGQFENGRDIAAENVTMCQNFLNQGYNCFQVGKWHNGVNSFRRSFNGGANVFFGGMWDHWNVPVCDYRESGEYDQMVNFVPNFSANMTPIQVLADRINVGVHSTDLFAGAAIEFLEQYEEEKPFFLYLSFLAPHDPRTMPEEFKHMYDPGKISLPPNFYPMPHFSFGWSDKGRDESTAGFPRQPQEIRRHIAEYYAMISHIDSYIGALLDVLENKGFMENTIIVLCGDNGLAVGQHGLMGKQNIYDHSVHVPLIMSGPGIPRGQIREHFVYLMDMYPTLCDLCGLEIPGTVEAKSFAPMFTDSEYVTRADIYLAFQARIRAVQNERYKLIEYRSEELKLTQLFDLEIDPWEMMNFYEFMGYEGVTAQLRKRMQEYREEWNEDQHLYGRQFWQQWHRYEEAELHGVDRPKGASMANQVIDWVKVSKK